MKEIKQVLEYIKRFKLKSIFVNYFKTFFIIMMFFSCIIFIYFSISNPKKREVIENNTILGERISEYINSEFDTLNRMATMLSSDSNINIMIESKEPILFNKLGVTHNINLQKVFKTCIRSKPYINSIHIYAYNSNFVYSTKGNAYFETSMYKDIIEQGVESLNHGIPGITTYESTDGSPCINIIFPLDLFNDVGIVLFVIDETSFFNEIAKDFDDFSHSTVYVTKTGEIIHSNNQEEFGKNINDTDYINVKGGNRNKRVMINNEKVYAYSTNSYVSDAMTVISYTNKDESSVTPFIIVIVFIMALLISFVISITFSVKLFSPIEKVIETMEANDFETDSLSAHKNEIDYILNNFMVKNKRNYEMKEELVQMIISLKDAQNIALNSQITPHFLFNVLQTISISAIDMYKGNNEITEYIQNLSNMLHISLRNDNFIPFFLEVKHARIYSKIQLQMHKSMLNIEWKLGEYEYSNIQVPKIILQPVIENAIEHGVLKSGVRGTVIIEAAEIENNFFITVKNDGKIITKEDEIHINMEMEENRIKSDHIGLHNVNSRIKLMYGNKYGCRIEKEENYTIVTILLPNK